MVINNQQINQETNSRICKIDIFHFDAYVRGCTLGFPSSRKQKKVNEERKMEIGRRERKREKVKRFVGGGGKEQRTRDTVAKRGRGFANRHFPSRISAPRRTAYRSVSGACSQKRKRGPKEGKAWLR